MEVEGGKYLKIHDFRPLLFRKHAQGVDLQNYNSQTAQVHADIVHVLVVVLGDRIVQVVVLPVFNVRVNMSSAKIHE